MSHAARRHPKHTRSNEDAGILLTFDVGGVPIDMTDGTTFRGRVANRHGGTPFADLEPDMSQAGVGQILMVLPSGAAQTLARENEYDIKMVLPGGPPIDEQDLLFGPWRITHGETP